MLKPVFASSNTEAINKIAAAVQRKSPEPWAADDIITACKQNRAFCFVSNDRKTTVVLEPIADEYPTVHIWIAHSTQDDALKTYEPEIERLARAIGAKRLTFTSKRKGYQRALPHWQRNGNHYQRKLL